MTETAKTIARAVALCIIEVASLCGVSMSEDTATTIAFGAVALAAFIYTTWKNTNVTKAAVAGQAVTDGIKAGVDMSAQVDDRKDDGDEGVA